MKKLVLTSICTLAVAGAAFAQGTVNWSGPSFSFYTTQTNGTAYSPLFGGGTTGSGTVGSTSTAASGFYFDLLYTAYSGNGVAQTAQPTTLAQLATWSDASLLGNNSTTSAGRNAVTTSNPAQVVPWANGVTQSVMLVEWSANLGTTWSGVGGALAALQADVTANAYFGISQTGFITPNVAPNNGATLFGNTPTANGLPIGSSTLTQLYLVPVTPVPEPGTIAMAALGGLSLLAFRRKK